jgi:hypothetical protein
MTRGSAADAKAEAEAAAATPSFSSSTSRHQTKKKSVSFYMLVLLLLVQVLSLFLPTSAAAAAAASNNNDSYRLPRHRLLRHAKRRDYNYIQEQQQQQQQQPYQRYHYDKKHSKSSQSKSKSKSDTSSLKYLSSKKTSSAQSHSKSKSIHDYYSYYTSSATTKGSSKSKSKSKSQQHPEEKRWEGDGSVFTSTVLLDVRDMASVTNHTMVLTTMDRVLLERAFVTTYNEFNHTYQDPLQRHITRATIFSLVGNQLLVKTVGTFRCGGYHHDEPYTTSHSHDSYDDYCKDDDPSTIWLFHPPLPATDHNEDNYDLEEWVMSVIESDTDEATATSSSSSAAAAEAGVEAASTPPISTSSPTSTTGPPTFRPFLNTLDSVASYTAKNENQFDGRAGDTNEDPSMPPTTIVEKWQAQGYFWNPHLQGFYLKKKERSFVKKSKLRQSQDDETEEAEGENYDYDYEEEEIDYDEEDMDPTQDVFTEFATAATRTGRFRTPTTEHPQHPRRRRQRERGLKGTKGTPDAITKAVKQHRKAEKATFPSYTTSTTSSWGRAPTEEEFRQAYNQAILEHVELRRQRVRPEYIGDSMYTVAYEMTRVTQLSPVECDAVMEDFGSTLFVTLVGDVTQVTMEEMVRLEQVILNLYQDLQTTTCDEPYFRQLHTVLLQNNIATGNLPGTMVLEYQLRGTCRGPGCRLTQRFFTYDEPTRRRTRTRQRQRQLKYLSSMGGSSLHLFQQQQQQQPLTADMTCYCPTFATEIGPPSIFDFSDLLQSAIEDLHEQGLLPNIESSLDVQEEKQASLVVPPRRETFRSCWTIQFFGMPEAVTEAEVHILQTVLLQVYNDLQLSYCDPLARVCTAAMIQFFDPMTDTMLAGQPTFMLGFELQGSCLGGSCSDNAMFFAEEDAAANTNTNNNNLRRNLQEASPSLPTALQCEENQIPGPPTVEAYAQALSLRLMDLYRDGTLLNIQGSGPVEEDLCSTMMPEEMSMPTFAPTFVETPASSNVADTSAPTITSTDTSTTTAPTNVRDTIAPTTSQATAATTATAAPSSVGDTIAPTSSQATGSSRPPSATTLSPTIAPSNVADTVPPTSGTVAPTSTSAAEEETLAPTLILVGTRTPTAGPLPNATEAPTTVAGPNATTVAPTTVAGPNETTAAPTIVATVAPTMVAGPNETTLAPTTVAVPNETTVAPTTVAGPNGCWSQ